VLNWPQAGWGPPSRRNRTGTLPEKAEALVDKREKKRETMRYVAIGFCFMLGCQPTTRTATTSPTGIRASTMFTDSAIYRCKEADTIAKLTVIPRECTLRDQRVEIR